MSGAAVTPSGVREGDPAALTALCAVRGPSVLAYCRQVAGEAEAAAAAADAFACFRAAVVAADDPSRLNPEALLINATRTTAATRAGRRSEGVCAEVPSLLAAKAERTISLGDLERLQAHLSGCWACRAPVARFKAAERSYRDPPETRIDPAIAAQIVAALLAAAPIPPPAPRQSADDAAPAAPTAAVPEQAHVNGTARVDQATAEFRTPDVVEPPQADDAAPINGKHDFAAPPARGRRRASLLGALGLRSSQHGLRLPPLLEEPDLDFDPAPAADPAPAQQRRGAQERTIGAHLPRVRRAPAPRAQGVQAGAARRLSGVLPVALVFVALFVALSVAGVLGGSDPASSPRVSVPASEPAHAPAPAVVVRGAKEASRNAVEVAKARERARAQRKREAALEREPASSPDASPASATAVPAPERDSAPGAAKPAPQPEPEPEPQPERDRGGAAPDDSRGIDAGSGATGADQIPPAQDTSTVPALVPPSGGTP